jgi:hypothetical protein
MRSGKGGSRLLARQRPLPTRVGGSHGAVRASGYAARGRRPSNTHVRPVTGLALAHLRDLLARHASNQARGSARAIPGRAGPRRPHAGVSARTTCCKSNDSRHDQLLSAEHTDQARRALKNVLQSWRVYQSSRHPFFYSPRCLLDRPAARRQPGHHLQVRPRAGRRRPPRDRGLLRAPRDRSSLIRASAGTWRLAVAVGEPGREGRRSSSDATYRRYMR